MRSSRQGLQGTAATQLYEAFGLVLHLFNLCCNMLQSFCNPCFLLSLCSHSGLTLDMLDHLGNFSAASFSRVSCQYARANSFKSSLYSTPLNTPTCAQRISTYGLKMTGVIAFARGMRIRFIFVSLIYSWLSLSAAVRPHSADWGEA